MTQDPAPPHNPGEADPTYLAGKPMSKGLRRVLFIYLGGLTIAAIATVTYLYKQHAKQNKPPPVKRAPILAPEEVPEAAQEKKAPDSKSEAQVNSEK